MLSAAVAAASAEADPQFLYHGYAPAAYYNPFLYPTLKKVEMPKMEKDGQVTHTYFEKKMKNQKVLEKGSAMGKKQKYCILSEEVTRRLYNVEKSQEGEEVEKILENMTRQLKNSGWERIEVREMVTSGYIAWRR